MNTWVMSTRGRGARWAAVGFVSLLAAAELASRASAEHSVLEQVSIGPTGGNGAFESNLVGASADGGRVFFVTGESLVSADTDVAQDLYERSGGQTTLVSTGPAGGNGAFDALLHFDRLYVGGGNAKKLKVDLGHRVEIVDNTAGILGGIKLWGLAEN